jgi:hypothetical protein
MSVVEDPIGMTLNLHKNWDVAVLFVDNAKVNVQGGGLGMLVAMDLLPQVQSHFQLVNRSLKISKLYNKTPKSVEKQL